MAGGWGYADHQSGSGELGAAASERDGKEQRDYQCLQTPIDQYAPRNRSMDNGLDGWEAGCMPGWKNGKEVESTWVDTGKEESIDRKIDGCVGGWMDGQGDGWING